MGRNALHTQEQVFEVADRLAANGQEVTPTALRAALGGGSLTTIYKHLAAWQTSKKDTPAPVVYEMPESVKAAFSACWQTAASEAAKEVAVVREKADQEVKAVSRRLDEAIGSIAQLEAEAEADAARIEDLEGKLAAERAASVAAATQAAGRESGLTATVEQMGRQIEAQAAELTRVHADQEAARQAHAAEAARLTTDFARQLAEQAEALRAAHEEITRLRSKHEEDTQRAEAAIERVRARLDEEAAKAAQAQQREHQVVAELAAARADAERLTAALAQRDTDIAKLNEEAAAAIRSHGITMGECSALREQVAKQLEVISALGGQVEQNSQNVTKPAGKPGSKAK